MNQPAAYQSDLAYIHHHGYGQHAQEAAPAILKILRENNIKDGTVVDLGCGSGIWARALCDAGYQVIGVDLSSAMIELARERVPEAELHVASFLKFPIPHCQAVTALGEIFNYLFDASNSFTSLRRVCKTIHQALTPGGVLMFDIAEPGRSRGVTQSFRRGKDWACLVEYEHDGARKRLTRRIVTFRKTGDVYRQAEEIHKLQLYGAKDVARMLRDHGFRVRVMRNYGKYRLPEKLAAFVARKPLRDRPSR
jgi:SAM-dependent methyltransferase